MKRLCTVLLSTFLLSTGVVLGQVVAPGGRYDLQAERRHPMELLFMFRTISLPIWIVVPDQQTMLVDRPGDVTQPKDSPVVIGLSATRAHSRSGPIERPILSGPTTGRSPDEMFLQGAGGIIGGLAVGRTGDQTGRRAIRTVIRKLG